jgi:hypothetical protein
MMDDIFIQRLSRQIFCKGEFGYVQWRPFVAPRWVSHDDIHRIKNDRNFRQRPNVLA